MSGTQLNHHLLIAMPSLEDNNFSRTVTYICEHNDDGALGITINRQSDILMSEIFQQLGLQTSHDDIASQPVFVGGPVQQDRGFVLHTPVGNWDSSLQVTDDIAVTTSRDIIEAMAVGNPPEACLFALGYAGWAPGQLENEISQNAWLSCPATKQILFETPVEQRWDEAARLLGVDLQLLTNDPGHA